VRMSLSVHSIHLNIDNGDGAVHLLIDETTTPTKPIVHKAVWIDGGLPISDVVNTLKALFAEIQDAYTWSSQHGFVDGQIAFDSIVISKYHGEPRIHHTDVSD
jgi:hypothetical protein